MKNYTIIANWKMYFTHNQALNWLESHQEQLNQSIGNKKCTLILCPSFDVLSPFSSLIKNSSLKLGAQDCSAFKPGAYTGQIQAESLAQIGCSYCIIGHSETRSLLCQTNNAIAQKLQHLFVNNIIPIICIGESTQQRQQGQSEEAIAYQLDALKAVFKHNDHKEIYIAYEPIWAIGTGIPATPEDINQMFLFIESYFQKNTLKIKPKLLYGGSINSKNCVDFNKLELLQGFLIGKASTDFKQLNTIINTIAQ